MYQVSEATSNILNGNQRTFRAKIVAGGNEITTGIISVKLYQNSTASNYISIGDTVAAYVDVKMWKTDLIDLENDELEISIGPVVDGEPDYIPFGLFTAQKPVHSNGISTFTAYDRFYSMLSGEYNSFLNYPADGKAVLEEISQITGVPIDTSNLPDGVMIRQKASSVEMSMDEYGNTVTTTKYENPYDGYSYRDAIGFIAQFYCKFATVNRAGTVVFRWYADDLGEFEPCDFSVAADRYYDDLTIGESEFTVKAITCVVGEKTLGSGAGLSSIQMENPVMTQEALDGIYEKVKGLAFYPVSMSFFGDIRLELGDCITAVDKAGNEFAVPLMYIVQDYDGGVITEVASYGRTQQEENSSKGPTAQKLAQLESAIAVVKEIVGKKADFEEIVSKMITTDKILFDNMTIVEFYEQMIETNSSIEKTIDGLSLDVSSLSAKKNISNNSEIQTYNVTEVPTLENYPTTTDFFIWDVCSDTLYCSDDLICGTNDYDNHLGEISYNENNGLYYVFEANTDGVYGWRQMTDEEVTALADRYASISVASGEVDIVAGYEDEKCEVKITSDGMRATVFYCC